MIKKLRINFGKNIKENSFIIDKAIKQPAIEQLIKGEDKISKQGNIHKIEIRNCSSVKDYVSKIETSDRDKILEMFGDTILLNRSKNMSNNGICYLIVIKNTVYNILYIEGIFEIIERSKFLFDEVSNKKDVILQRIIIYNPKKNKYTYHILKSEVNGITYYTKSYDKNRKYSLGDLDLTKEETYYDVKSIIYSLESVEGIEDILDMESLKENILKDLSKNLSKRKTNK